MEKEIFPAVYRRLRSNAMVRSLISPLKLSHQSFILPLFIEESLNKPRLVEFMNGVQVETTDTVHAAIDHALHKGISKFLLFPIPGYKSEHPTDFSFASNLVQQLKQKYKNEIWLASDICLCSYTTHGHCGLMNKEATKVLNAESVNVLTLYALEIAEAGIDCIAPSDMMDGRIKSIRQALDFQGNHETLIMAYSTKFSSQWYGPFRDACHSTPTGTSLTDRKSYQLSPLNNLDALNCAIRDESEGADILMVKPAGLYTDITALIKSKTHSPIATYHVSGEYAAIEQLANQGMFDRQKAHLEAWAAFTRSGADIIISYAAANAKNWISTYDY